MQLIIGMAILAAVLVMPTASTAAAACYKDTSCAATQRSSVARILPPRCGCARDDADCLQCCLCIRRGGRPQRCCM
jgi:hypothetical protein